ncbi:hypothetical protein ACFQU7_42850 [Pseudoroseomonas wenyumeiae]
MVRPEKGQPLFQRPGDADRIGDQPAQFLYAHRAVAMRTKAFGSRSAVPSLTARALTRRSAKISAAACVESSPDASTPGRTCRFRQFSDQSTEQVRAEPRAILRTTAQAKPSKRNTCVHVLLSKFYDHRLSQGRRAGKGFSQAGQAARLRKGRRL